VLRRGVGARALLLAAGALLAVVVPILSVAIPAENRGGFGTDYPVDRIAVHWVTAAALVLIAFALARTLAAARRSVSRARERPVAVPAGEPAAAAVPGPAP
jgi:arabinofuranan 3-O-arabinosyltransferase